MMRKALSFLGCLLLSIGSVAAEPVNHLLDEYWFVEKDASTSTTEDGEQVVGRTLTAGDTIAYCTFKPAKTQKVDSGDEDEFPIQVDTLVFNNTNDCVAIPDGSGYFVRMKAKFTPRTAPQVSAPNGEDFPYRTLLYVKDEGEGNPSHLAFLERKKDGVAAQEVVTDIEATAETLLDITVQILKDKTLKDKTFRVYVGESEVTVGGSPRPYRSLQNGDGGHYYAEYLHSFAFTGSVELTDIAFTTENPFVKTVTSIPFKFVYDQNALSDITGVADTLDLTVTKTYTINFTRDTDQYDFEPPTLTGNLATLGAVNDTSITFTVADTLTDDNQLVLTLPSKAYFFTFGNEKYGTFSEVIAAASKSGKPIQLTHDINLDGHVTPGPQAEITDNQDVVIDLNGKTIVGLNYRENANDAAIVNRGNLKIIDSDPEKKGKIVANGYALSASPTSDTLALGNYANETIIKDGTFVGIVTNVAGRIQIDGGRFLNVFNETNAADFYLRRQAGVSIGARFDVAEFTTLEDREFWIGNEATDLIEFRVETPSYTKLSKKLYSKTEHAEGLRPTVTAAGYKVSKINWLEPDEYGIVRGELTAENYTVAYNTGNKAEVSSSAPTSYTVDAEPLELPTLTNELWDFVGWYVGDKEVKSLGDFATFDETGSLPDDLIFGDLILVAKWKPIEKSWTNAMKGARYMDMAEANGFYPTDTSKWQFTIPSNNGFESGDSIKLKSITLSTVNASTNNLARTAPKLKLSVAGTDFVAEREDFAEKAAAQDKFEPEPSLYFETNFGFRPKVVYSFDDPVTLTIGAPYTFTLVNAEGAHHPVLLRLVKKTSDTEFQLIGTIGNVPSPDYQSYVPMYEIVGEATDVIKGAE